MCFDVGRLIGGEDFELRPCKKFSGYSYMDLTGSQKARSRKARRWKPEAGSRTGPTAGSQKPEQYTVQYTVQYIAQSTAQYTVQYTLRKMFVYLKSGSALS